MKLSKMEAAILAAMETAPDDDWDIEELAMFAYNKRKKKRPVNWYASLAATMRTMVLKTNRSATKVVRSSQLGSGHMATYRLKRGKGKNAATLLERAAR